jgi:hypothetical protein
VVNWLTIAFSDSGIACSPGLVGLTLKADEFQLSEPLEAIFDEIASSLFAEHARQLA